MKNIYIVLLLIFTTDLLAAAAGVDTDIAPGTTVGAKRSRHAAKIDVSAQMAFVPALLAVDVAPDSKRGRIDADASGETDLGVLVPAMAGAGAGSPAEVTDGTTLRATFRGYCKRAQYDEALAFAKEIEKSSHPIDPELLSMIVEAYYKGKTKISGANERIIGLSTRAIKEQGESVFPYFFLRSARAYGEMGNAAEALKFCDMYEKAIAKLPIAHTHISVDQLWELAFIYKYYSQFSKAAPLYVQAIKLLPTDKLTIERLEEIAKVHYEIKDCATPAKLYDLVLAKKKARGDLDFGWVSRAVAAHAGNNNYDRIITIYEENIAEQKRKNIIKPEELKTMAETLDGMLAEYEEEGYAIKSKWLRKVAYFYGEAIKALGKDAGTGFLQDAGTTHAKAGNFDAAIGLYGKVIEMEGPEKASYSLYYHLAKAHFNKGNLKEVHELLPTVLGKMGAYTKGEGDAEGLYLIAQVWEANGRIAEALYVYESMKGRYSGSWDVKAEEATARLEAFAGSGAGASS